MKEILTKCIYSALSKLYENDIYLINYDKMHNSERAVVFRFGIYFNEILSIELPEYVLDSEYNRSLSGVKTLPCRENGSYPDLIVHKRGQNDDNLLVIEFKTWWNSGQNEDKQKIIEYCDKQGEYKYKYGVTVLLNKELKSVEINFSEDV